MLELYSTRDHPQDWDLSTGYYRVERLHTLHKYQDLHSIIKGRLHALEKETMNGLSAPKSQNGYFWAERKLVPL